METCGTCKHFDPESDKKCGLFKIDLEINDSIQETPIAPGQPNAKAGDLRCSDWQPRSE